MEKVKHVARLETQDSARLIAPRSSLLAHRSRFVSRSDNSNCLSEPTLSPSLGLSLEEEHQIQTPVEI